MITIEIDDFLKESDELELNERINKGFMALVWCICCEVNVDESSKLFGL